MAASNSPLAPLVREQRRQLEAWLIDFDHHWGPGQLRARLAALPAALSTHLLGDAHVRLR
jgi:hypothetical protein